MNRLEESYKGGKQLENVVCIKPWIGCMELDPKNRPDTMSSSSDDLQAGFIMEQCGERIAKVGSVNLIHHYTEKAHNWEARDGKQVVNRQREKTFRSNSCVLYKFNSWNLFSKRARRDFVGNGGLILKEVSGLMIFSKKGIKKITKNYSELLGNGSFGVVYKGTLPDNTMVAVRPDHKVRKYYTENGFTDHLESQTQMIHKNILKLIGCCLEVEIPILVYELAHAVSLEDILCAREKALPLDLRLDIAIGCAQGLRCIHSFPSEIHGDIRTDNILLDDRFTPKITGFVLSNLHVGQLRYIDPMVRHTETFMPKSDVYTFGIVLLGLISRKQSAYYECHNLIIDFREVYEKDKSGRSMFDKDIATEEDIFCLEEIGKRAIDCLKQDIEDRPDMVEVEERLVMLRRDRMLKKIGREVQHMLFSAIHSKQ